MIDSVPLIQNANDVQQINASIIAMKKVSRELDEKIAQFNKLLSQEITNREKAITEAINSLDVASVGGSGKYISAISETDGKISATAGEITTTVSSGNSQPVTSGGVADAINKIELVNNADTNTCYPSENNKIGYYQGIFTSNVPDTHATQAILTSVRTLRADSSYTEIYQQYEVCGYSSIGNYAPIIYTRYGYYGSGTPVWSSWTKIIRNYDLNPSWVDTGILSSSLGAIKYKKIGSLVALHIISTGGALKITTNGGAMKKVVEGVETIVYLPEEIRPTAGFPINFALIDNTFDTVFHARIQGDGTIIAWNNTLKNLQDVNSWNLSIVYSI